MDKRQEFMSQAASKADLEIHSSASSDTSGTDSNQELEAYIDDYEREYWIAHKAEYKRNRASSKLKMNIPSAELKDSSDADSCPDIESAIDSCKDSLPLRKTGVKYRQEFQNCVSVIRDFLDAHQSECKRTEYGNKLKMANLGEELDENSELDSGQEFRRFVGAYRDRFDAEDEREPEKDVHSSDLDEASVVDNNQEFEACVDVCTDSSKPEMDIVSAELHGNSDEDNTPNIEAAITSCRDLRALRKISKKYRQEFKTYISDIRDYLVALQSECKRTEDESKPKMVIHYEELDDTSEVDSGQEFETFGGAYRDWLDARQTEKRTEDESEPKKDVHSSGLDETSDPDTSQEFEACTDAYTDIISYLTERKRVQNDESLDVGSKIDALREGNARLEKSCEILRRCTEKRKEDIRRVKSETDIIHRLQDLLFNTKGSKAMEELDLDEIIEGCNSLLRRRKN